jgi:aconitate decarboxylase
MGWTADATPLTSGLAHFIAHIHEAGVPSSLFEHMKLCLLDSIGCGLFGSTLPWTNILTGTLSRLDTDRSTVVWGTARRLGPAHAALANGAAVHGFELDDLHRESILHPGAVVVPAVLSTAMLQPDVAGDEILLAMIAGYEVGARVGMALGAAHLLQGWHPTGTHGAIAAAAACASLLRLTPGQAQHALGIAGSQSSGLMAAQYSSMVKRFHAGRAAQSGVYAANLAAAGYTGITNLFESKYGGYLTTFSPESRPDALLAGIGRDWQAERVGFKPYAANGSCHPTIDLLRRLRADHGFLPADVEAVEIAVSSATVAHVGWPYVPDSTMTAQMNLPYIVAVVIADGEAFVDQFSSDRIADAQLVQLSRRVTVTADPEIDSMGDSWRHATRLQIRLRDGRVLDGEARSARGSASDPLTPEDVRAKYRTLASKVFDVPRVAHLEDLIGHLEDATAAELADALAISTPSRESPFRATP